MICNSQGTVSRKPRMAIIIKLSEEETEKVQWLRYHAESARTRQWLEVLWLLHLSESVVEVMRIAGVSKRTVGRVRLRYSKEGLAGLLEDRHYRAVSELDQFEQIIRTAFEEKPPRTVAEAAQRIEELTGVRRSNEPVRLFMKRLGMSFRQVAAI